MKYRVVEYQEAEQMEKVLFLDMRSESEYQEAHIPGAINMPVLNDEERRLVGTLYKEGKKEEAKLEGVKAITKKLVAYFAMVQELSKDYKLVLYCKSGGYRSTAFFRLLDSLDEKVFKLNYGYKGYRKYITARLEEKVKELNFINLNGLTGTGKTEILKELEKRGQQVLDLEGLANHRGSLLGQIGLGEQISQKQFESYLYDKIKTFDQRPVFVESESIKIGSLYLPKYLYDSYKNSPHQVFVKSSLKERVKRIHKEYIKETNKDFLKEVQESFQGLNKYMKKERLDGYIETIKQGQVDLVIEELIVKYYDQGYSIKEKNFELEIDSDNMEEEIPRLMGKYTM